MLCAVVSSPSLEVCKSVGVNFSQLCGELQALDGGGGGWGVAGKDVF